MKRKQYQCGDCERFYRSCRAARKRSKLCRQCRSFFRRGGKG